MPIPTVFASYQAKQLRVDDLNDLQRVAFDVAFPLFATRQEPSVVQRADLQRAAVAGIPTTWQCRPSRRFAGDESLPTGRYYTLIRTAAGDDGKDLVMELAAYHDPQAAGPIALLDLGDETDRQRLFGEPACPLHALALVFLEPAGAPRRSWTPSGRPASLRTMLACMPACMSRCTCRRIG